MSIQPINNSSTDSAIIEKILNGNTISLEEPYKQLFSELFSGTTTASQINNKIKFIAKLKQPNPLLNQIALYVLFNRTLGDKNLSGKTPDISQMITNPDIQSRVLLVKIRHFEALVNSLIEEGKLDKAFDAVKSMPESQEKQKVSEKLQEALQKLSKEQLNIYDNKKNIIYLQKSSEIAKTMSPGPKKEEVLKEIDERLGHLNKLNNSNMNFKLDLIICNAASNSILREEALRDAINKARDIKSLLVVLEAIPTDMKPEAAITKAIDNTKDSSLLFKLALRSNEINTKEKAFKKAIDNTKNNDLLLKIIQATDNPDIKHQAFCKRFEKDLWTMSDWSLVASTPKYDSASRTIRSMETYIKNNLSNNAIAQNKALCLIALRCLNAAVNNKELIMLSFEVAKKIGGDSQKEVIENISNFVRQAYVNYAIDNKLGSIVRQCNVILGIQSTLS